MKKILTLLLGLMLICSLFSACSGSQEVSPNTQSNTPDISVNSENAEESTPTQENENSDQSIESNKPDESAAPSGTPDEMARQFLDALENCPPVKAEDNRMGFGIDRIEKVGDNYDVFWKTTTEIDNRAAFFMITFYDPADYSNIYQGFTKDENGRTKVEFSEGESTNYDHVRVKFTTDSKVVYMFFEGWEDVPKEHYEKYYTVPLFYTLILDDNPHVLESTTRAANGIFGE